MLLFVMFIAEMCRYRKPSGDVANIAAGIFALLYVGIMLRFAVAAAVWSGGIGALASWIIVVKMGDTGAYAVGRLIGRHKMAPLISPGKTIEGAVGALVFSCLGSWLDVSLAGSPRLVHLNVRSSTSVVGMDRLRPAGRQRPAWWATWPSRS